MFWTELKWGNLYHAARNGLLDSTLGRNPALKRKRCGLVGILRPKPRPHNGAMEGKLTNTARLSVALSPQCRNIWFAHLSCRHMKGCEPCRGNRNLVAQGVLTHWYAPGREGARVGGIQGRYWELLLSLQVCFSLFIIFTLQGTVSTCSKSNM